MISNARGSHSSPGIYTKEIDLSYASKSLGITTLGVVGETLKGPAFEPIKIENWREFQEYFGGTSAEKFVGSKYPKYELPYIAKSYLKNSNQLEVCRVLGLSGYNAGPAWLITAQASEEGKYVEIEKLPETLAKDELTDHKDEIPTNKITKYVTVSGKNYEWVEEEYVVAVLRSRGSYNEYGNSTYNACDGSGVDTYDMLTYFTKEVSTKDYSSATIMLSCPEQSTSEPEDGYAVNENNFGRFTIVVVDNKGVEHTYPVSLNPGDKDYIINVLGTGAQDGDAPLFVEELYDVALSNMIYQKKIGRINKDIEPITEGLNEDWTPSIPSKERVLGFKEIPQEELTIKNLGQRFVDGLLIYEVETKVENGKRVYQYKEVGELEENERLFVISKNKYYQVKGGALVECNIDVNDYKEQFRCASTPWVVSELKGDGKNVELKKLFRFHTISDGNAANSEVKVSIQNIRPDEGLFDVVVRRFDDMDSNPSVLERFSKCSMVPGTNNFIGFKIGTFDGEYVIKSKYITVEVIVNDMTESCVPAGFLGYPMRKYEGIENPEMGYNVYVDEDINPKKQYFGFSNLTGIDVDLFNYKGRSAYNNPDALSHGFHLDSYLNIEGMKFTVDGSEDEFKFITVAKDNYSNINGGAAPRFGSEADMVGTIYENVNLRKFTMCFYGGFDGWDIYRESRTNTDKFKTNKYKGSVLNGYGKNFMQINDAEALNLTGKCITSDYYAYLAGIRQFANPEAVDINVFATPGIDYVNNKYLSHEALSMIEEERGDALYVMTTPDKEFGNSDNDMLYPDEVVDNLYQSEIDSSYATTYYPWVKYYDVDNKVYINLPVTKDVVRSLAYTDNTSYPWFAPAGIIRGGVECEKAHFITKLEDEDMLYEGMINPVKTFASDGVKIWGQKTMYSGDTPLNRINVRRLMLRVKKLISGACRRLIFEQNDATVKSQFESLVKPILNDIKSKRGIYDYRLEVQDSPEARDRMELPAVIYIKPTKALEYIDLSFVIMPESAKFDE